MGDVLAGVIAALRAQGLDGYEAALCGALVHGCAGDRVANDGGERGLLASDLLPAIRQLVNPGPRSEEHTSELQSLMRISYAVFCLKKKKKKHTTNHKRK